MEGQADGEESNGHLNAGDNEEGPAQIGGFSKSIPQDAVNYFFWQLDLNA